MSVIVEVSVSTDDFELGRLLSAGLTPDAVVELETVVPVGDGAVPYLRVRTAHLEEFLDTVREEAVVDRLRVVDDYDDQHLLAFDWAASRDPLFDGILVRSGVAILSAYGGVDRWTFELRFDDHSEFEAFRDECTEAGVGLDLLRIYRPSSPGTDLSFGLTERQREALVLAVARGYYEVPRGYTTADLAEELGISDQAVSERLRRGVARLVANTLRPETDANS
jgi:predicted DNA binding protein